MLDFTYYNPCKVVFGASALNELKSLLEQNEASSLLLVYSGEFVKDLGIYQHVQDTCDQLGIAFSANGDVVPNPRIELVRMLVQQGKETGVNFVLAVGGGSAIDTAKAVALGIPYDGDVWDFFAGKVNYGMLAEKQAVVLEGAQIRMQPLPIGVITTLPSSGSETSNCAILSNDLLKLGYEDDAIIPKFAIMNPEYTLGLPAYQTSCGIADVLSHLLERYFSDVPDTGFSDHLIEAGIKSLLDIAKRLKQDSRDLGARSELQWLASVAHNNLLDAGRCACWGAHRIEHELSAQYNITHGEGMAVVTLAWLRYVAKIKPHMPAKLAKSIFGINVMPCVSATRQEQNIYQEQTVCQEQSENPDEIATYKLADELEVFFKNLDLATTLTELGIDNSHFNAMAARCTKDDTQVVGHYLPIDSQVFINILSLAM
ncbi:MAG: iron-containing alcohol dehydrogenase [Coriobacteriales bacterium]|jgi:alcohol dehydrogenase YqhD (iron-dependent ADH family)|nr:iron-containing alcohol dehydrogenase [Coriobacteriales bacterium]